MGRDVLHRMADIFQRGILPGAPTHTVAQNERCIAHLVQLFCRRNAFAQFRAREQRIAPDDEGVLSVFLAAGEIIDLHPGTCRLFGNLCLGVDLISDLHAFVVVFDHPIQTLCAVRRRILVHKFIQRAVRPAYPLAGVVQFLAVSVNARPLDAGVFAQFLHRGLRGDDGFALFPFGKGGQGQHQHQAEQHSQPSQDVFHRHSPFRCPGPERTSPPTGLSSRSARAKAARIFFYCSTTGRFRKGFSDKKEHLLPKATAPGGQLPGRRAVSG